MAGTAIATVGMWLLSATQNAVDRRDLGIATGTVSFFRLLREQPLRATVADGSPADVV